MSRARSRRWQPAGCGWIVTRDSGDVATWMRPRLGGGVDVAQYADLGYGDGWEAWVVACPPGSDLPFDVMDKHWRISAAAWDDSEHVGIVVSRRQVHPSHLSHRRHQAGYPRRDRRAVYRWPLPAPIRRALGDL